MPKPRGNRIKGKKPKELVKPKGAKTSPPVIPNDAYLKAYIESRQKNLNNNPSKITFTDLEKEYLLNTLELLKARIEPTLAPVVNGCYPDFKYTPPQLFNAIYSYFKVSLIYGQPLTINGITSFCGIDKNYLTPAHQAKLPKEYKFLFDCLDFVEFFMEFSGQKKQNPAFQIFWLKNRGWKDTFSVESVTPGALTDDERAEAQKRLAGFSEVIKDKPL